MASARAKSGPSGITMVKSSTLMNCTAPTRNTTRRSDKTPDVTPCFAELEERLEVSRKPPTVWTETCIAAAEESGFRRKEDLNDGSLSGFLGYEWMNIRGEDRRNSYVAFVKPHRARPNLELCTSAT